MIYDYCYHLFFGIAVDTPNPTETRVSKALLSPSFSPPHTHGTKSLIKSCFYRMTHSLLPRPPLSPLSPSFNLNHHFFSSKSCILLDLITYFLVVTPLLGSDHPPHALERYPEEDVGDLGCSLEAGRRIHGRWYSIFLC